MRQLSDGYPVNKKKATPTLPQGPPVSWRLARRPIRWERKRWRTDNVPYLGADTLCKVRRGEGNQAMYQYILCGLKLETDIAFPELTPWTGAIEHPFDIEFRLGPVEKLWPQNEKGVQFQADGRSRIIF